MRSLASLLNCRRGTIAAEFAIALPLLVTILLGVVEIGRFTLLHQKIDRVASSVGDLVARAETLTTQDIDNIFLAVQHIASPFDIGANGAVIVSGVTATGGAAPRVAWQRKGAGAATATSHFGAAGTAATLPTGMLVRDGETVIVTEVFFDFLPFMFAEVAPAARLYRSALFRPRIAALDVLI